MQNPRSVLNLVTARNVPEVLVNNEWDPLSNFSLFDRQDLELDMYISIKILVVCLCLLRA